MRAVRCEAWGLDGLRLVELEPPEPAPHEVRVHLHAASLNYRDLLMLRGQYNPRQPLPLVLCSDGAGVVDAVGDEVTEFAVGDRVTTTFFTAWEDGAPTSQSLRTSRGGPVTGCLQQYICAPPHALVRTPEHLTDVEASTLPCAAVTAWNAMIEQGALRAGQSVLVLGTGGVSTFAMLFARAAGLEVYLTSSSDEKLAFAARELGAHHLVNYRQLPAWGAHVRDLSGGGVDHVVEVGGAGTLAESLRAVLPGGTISLIGVLAAPDPNLNLTSVLMRNVRIQGVIAGNRRQHHRMNAAVSLHKLRPVVDRVFELEDARAAFEHLQSGAHIGKIVLTL